MNLLGVGSLGLVLWEVLSGAKFMVIWFYFSLQRLRRPVIPQSLASLIPVYFPGWIESSRMSDSCILDVRGYGLIALENISLA